MSLVLLKISDIYCCADYYSDVKPGLSQLLPSICWVPEMLL